MAEEAPPDLQAQIKQSQQNAWTQASAYQQPVHPMAAQGGSAMMPLSYPQSSSSQPTSSSKNATVSMGKMSLLGIAFSLMLLGAFTFLGGFLLGMWFEGPKPSAYVNQALPSQTPTIGLLPPQQQGTIPQAGAPQAMSPQTVPMSHHDDGGVRQAIGQESQDIGFNRIASSDVGYATQSAIVHKHIPDVPSFLTPLVTATQNAVGQQMGYKAQQQVTKQLNRAFSPSQSQTVPTTQPQTSPSSQPQTQTSSKVPSSAAGSTKSPSQTPQKNSSDNSDFQSSPGQQTTSQAKSGTSSETSSVSSNGKGEYTIQLGIYAAKENATALVNHLQDLNYTSRIIEGKSPEGSALYYVHSGDYNDYNTALDAASQYVSQNIPGAIVVKVSKNGKGTS
ncbi:MAG: SPOR domain-containing protein [Alphaproteobacteria bacterium]|nr:SPOR domain-containing protein [Alphaproteobacteria bacterium]